MAPEVIAVQDAAKRGGKKSKKIGYDKRCDIWSAGVVMYALLFGQLPFKGMTKTEIKERIKSKDPIFPDHDNMHPISAEARDLILNMLKKDVNDRISIEGIRKHPFFDNTPEPGSICVFNKSESQQMIKEFFFVEDEDYWRPRKVVDFNENDRHELHHYSENNLYSTDSDDDALRNMSTKSIVLAPRNSSEDEEEIPETNEALVAKIYAAK